MIGRAISSALAVFVLILLPLTVVQAQEPPVLDEPVTMDGPGIEVVDPAFLRDQPVEIELTDYAQDVDVIGEAVLSGPDEEPPCNFDIKLGVSSTEELMKTGRTNAVVPALCPNLDLVFTERVKQAGKNARGELDGSLVDGESVSRIVVLLDGKTYRSESLEKFPALLDDASSPESAEGKRTTAVISIGALSVMGVMTFAYTIRRRRHV